MARSIIKKTKPKPNSKNPHTQMVDPLRPGGGGGTKMLAVFGFCDIRDFETITEGLQQDVMTFVNTLSNIVHHNTHRYRVKLHE